LSGEYGNRASDDNSDQHLEQPKPEHDSAHRHQLRQRKLKANREHEENHPKFGHVACAFAVGYQPGSVGPDGDTNNKVAQNRGHVDATKKHHRYDGRREQHYDK